MGKGDKKGRELREGDFQPRIYADGHGLKCIYNEMDQMDGGFLFGWFVFLCKCFCGEGVPPSHVRVGKYITGMMCGIVMGCCLYA